MTVIEDQCLEVSINAWTVQELGSALSLLAGFHPPVHT